MANEEYHLYRSINIPDRVITIGEREDGTLFIGRGDMFLDEEENRFNTVEEIESYLDDEFEMIRPKPH